MFLGFYTVNFLLFRGNRVNIQGVLTDEATRKSLHNVYYINVCVKFVDFSQQGEKEKAYPYANC